MPEIIEPDNSVFGGSMSQEEFTQLEFHIEPHEPFQTDNVPYIDLTMNGQNRRLHPFNTSVIRYSQDEPTMFDHVLHMSQPPEYVFYNDPKGS